MKGNRLYNLFEALLQKIYFPYFCADAFLAGIYQTVCRPGAAGDIRFHPVGEMPAWTQQAYQTSA